MSKKLETALAASPSAAASARSANPTTCHKCEHVSVWTDVSVNICVNTCKKERMSVWTGINVVGCRIGVAVPIKGDRIDESEFHGSTKCNIQREAQTP